ncbi:hypothetical protein [Enemella sp. A6]|uniref:hypothetical protein n=1 Tax=Enemella sp. A6 TaxID=3440152 RepID=UPI003EBDBC4F
MPGAADTARSGVLGWVLIVVTALVLLGAILFALNYVSRDTLDPLPSNSTSAF